jgi:D-proline reductase (dithiol) PrdB
MGADDAIRERVGDIPAPSFETTAATVAPPLSEAKVAIVTTAGLRPSGDVRLWSTTDPSFTVLDAADRDVQLSHFSPNFDRSGFAQDLNVVYPIDRLRELVERGVIGSLAERNLSFMGAQMDATFSGIIQDSGPRAAQVLLDDDVDVILLTPI